MLVVGAGSIGARHGRNLAAAGASVVITDPDPSRAEASGLPTMAFDLDALGTYDGVVVASPTSFHPAQALAALEAGARVLVEKPLAPTAADLDGIVAAADGRVMVGYNLRWHQPVQDAIAAVRSGRAGRVLAVRVWFGSWLPDWRPAVDYRTTYSARADLGGGILNDAIHELDLLVWLFDGADFEVAGAIVSRVGPLEIDVEDTVRALLRHTSGAVAEVSLDYLSRRYRRGIEVVGDRATVRLDWAREVLEIEDADGVDSRPATTPLALSYERQAKHFLAFVREEVAATVDAATGADSVRLADAIRDAAR